MDIDVFIAETKDIGAVVGSSVSDGLRLIVALSGETEVAEIGCGKIGAALIAEGDGAVDTVILVVIWELSGELFGDF